jgi:hypothetical protein
MGGYFAYNNGVQETPNTQTSTFEYADGTIFEFATRGLLSNPEGGVMIGNIFYGTDGRLEIDGGGNWKTFFGKNDEPGPNSGASKGAVGNALNLVGSGFGGHFENFIEAVRTRNQESLSCDIEVGHRSSALAHIANVAYRLKKDLRFDGAKEQFIGDAAANKMLTRTYRKGFVVPKIA